MMRTCDGTDPNLVGENGQPCRCGQTFDDVNHMVVWPHEKFDKLGKWPYYAIDSQDRDKEE